MKIFYISILSFLLLPLLFVSKIAGQVRSTASAGIKIKIVKAASVSLNKEVPDENLISNKNDNSKFRDIIVNYKLVSNPHNNMPNTKQKSEEVDFMIGDSSAFKLDKEENLKIRKIDRTQNLNISYKNTSIPTKTNHKIAVTIVY